MDAIGRIVRSADFERVLGTRPRARSAHFALHHLAAALLKPATSPAETELSTARVALQPGAVDELPAQSLPCDPRVWLGSVVPKRHARRSVTRSLVKRQIRGAVARHGATLTAGLWVVRLRAPFDVRLFPSAASEALRRVARAELDALLADAARSSAALAPGRRRAA